MPRLTASFLDGRHIGTITQDSEGSLQVLGETPELGHALADLIHQIAKGPLYLVTGHEQETRHGFRWITARKECVPGDEDYLRALADTLLRADATLLGDWIQAEVLE
jgi:hypothetical protein